MTDEKPIETPPTSLGDDIAHAAKHSKEGSNGGLTIAQIAELADKAQEYADQLQALLVELRTTLREAQ